MKAAAILSAIIFYLACGGIAHATSTLSEVNAHKLEAGGYTFTIISQPLPHGAVQFHVVISDPAGHYDPSFDHASLGNVTIVQDGAARRSESVQTTRNLTLEKHEHSLGCDFTVEKADVANPDFCFIFTLSSRNRMPSVDFIFARLQKFLAAKP